MMQTTPPMGWNSWNTFGPDIHEDLIRETADILVESGLRDCGYRYLVIDDCWSEKERDGNGNLVPDKNKFPGGMKAVADYVHEKGLKFGMYSCAGMKTCAGYPSSFEHEFDDARTFAQWGVDFLKYDYCFKPGSVLGDVLYKRMGAALANCGRDILFSACSWGADETKKWIKTTGAHMWRSTGDIQDSWRSIKDLAMQADQSIKYSGQGSFFDMDMLVVGMYGHGNVGFVGCTDVEYRTHFSLWALLGTPLMIGCDLRRMNQATRDILTNREVIRINQDPACRQPYPVCGPAGYEDGYQYETPVYVRLLDNGDFAVGMFNFSDQTANAYCCNLRLDMLGLSESTGKTLLLTDLWTGEQEKVRGGFHAVDIAPHDCRLYRAKVVDR